MDITDFVVQGRDKALLYGDYSTYHSQLAKRLLNSRKKLGIATKNRGKFTKKNSVTAEEIGEKREYDRPANFTSDSMLTCSIDMSIFLFSQVNGPGRKQ